jgi:hypothetical protein
MNIHSLEWDDERSAFRRNFEGYVGTERTAIGPLLPQAAEELGWMKGFRL